MLQFHSELCMLRAHMASPTAVLKIKMVTLLHALNLSLKRTDAGDYIRGLHFFAR